MIFTTRPISERLLVIHAKLEAVDDRLRRIETALAQPPARGPEPLTVIAERAFGLTVIGVGAWAIGLFENSSEAFELLRLLL